MLFSLFEYNLVRVIVRYLMLVKPAGRRLPTPPRL